MSELKQNQSNWLGRSLENYIKQHPKAKGARSLTEAKAMAFGNKSKKMKGKK